MLIRPYWGEMIPKHLAAFYAIRCCDIPHDCVNLRVFRPETEVVFLKFSEINPENILPEKEALNFTRNEVCRHTSYYLTILDLFVTLFLFQLFSDFSEHDNSWPHILENLNKGKIKREKSQ